MEENKSIKVNLPVLIFVLIQLIFIILVAVVINRINSGETGVVNVEVEGLASEIPDLPEYGEEDIEYGIYAAISATTSEIDKKGIYIRDGSLIDIYYENVGKRYVNFIADIPAAERSYRVVAEWDDEATGDLLYDSGSGGRIGVLCLDSAELIYGEFDCKPWRGYMKYVIIGSLLDSLSSEIEENMVFTSEYSDDMEDYKVRITQYECDTMCYCKVLAKDEEERAAEGLTKFVEGLGFKASDVPYYFNDCGGETMWVDAAGDFHIK